MIVGGLEQYRAAQDRASAYRDEQLSIAMTVRDAAEHAYHAAAEAALDGEILEAEGAITPEQLTGLRAAAGQAYAALGRAWHEAAYRSSII